jgi:small GTP-binding protein
MRKPMSNSNTIKKSDLASRILDAVKGIGSWGIRLTSMQIDKIADKLTDELKDSPRIALIGETGVGKSSTLNALFNAGVPIDHVHPCTQEAIEYQMVIVNEIEGAKGPIRIFDMPGLGQDLASDEIHTQTYSRVLSMCDVALWILDATTRTLSQTQSALQGVVKNAMQGLDRLVIGLNKVDRIEPGKWNIKGNVPNKEQQEIIRARTLDVCERLKPVLQISNGRIVAYSATRRYHLGLLLKALIDACPKKRRWILYDRVALAKFDDLVDPMLLEEANKRKEKKSKINKGTADE